MYVCTNYYICVDQSRLLRLRLINYSDQDETYRLKQYDNHVFYPRRNSFFRISFTLYILCVFRDSLHIKCFTLDLYSVYLYYTKLGYAIVLHIN